MPLWFVTFFSPSYDAFMPIHVAILKRPYVKLILEGRKTVESRLTRTLLPPYDVIQAGQRIFLKVSSGPFMATAVAGRIDQYHDLSQSDVQQLRKRYDRDVCGNVEYWKLKRDSRYAVFVELRQVQPIEVGPAYPKSMRAWHVVDDKLNPIMDVTLTAGAIRNRYLTLPGTSTQMREHALTLLLPDDQTVVTKFAAGKAMLRWRGWGAYYQANQLKPGDVVRFVTLGGRRYRVSFIKK